MTEKVVFLTGAAGAIGSATAEKLAERGWTLYLVDLKSRKKDLENLKTSLPGSHFVDSVDLRDNRSIHSVVKRCIARTGRVDVLINNAGLMHPAPLLETTDEEIDDQLQTNLYGTLHLTHAMLPSIIESRGSIVFVSSLAAIVPAPIHSVYAATKAAVRSLSLSLHFELRPYGVSVSCVLPGTVSGPMTSRMARRKSSPMAYVNPPIEPVSVAASIDGAVYSGKPEFYVPYNQGLLSRLGVLFPDLLHIIYPAMAKKGKRNYEAWKASGLFAAEEKNKG